MGTDQRKNPGTTMLKSARIEKSWRSAETYSQSGFSAPSPQKKKKKMKKKQNLLKLV